MARDKEYVKGVPVQVLGTDKAGFPTNSIERDPDGQLWHVQEGEDPVKVDDDEVRSIAAEHANKSGSEGGSGSGGGTNG